MGHEDILTLKDRGLRVGHHHDDMILISIAGGINKVTFGHFWFPAVVIFFLILFCRLLVCHLEYIAKVLQCKAVFQCEWRWRRSHDFHVVLRILSLIHI